MGISSCFKISTYKSLQDRGCLTLLGNPAGSVVGTLARFSVSQLPLSIFTTYYFPLKYHLLFPFKKKGN